MLLAIKDQKLITEQPTEFDMMALNLISALKNIGEDFFKGCIKEVAIDDNYFFIQQDGNITFAYIKKFDNNENFEQFKQKSILEKNREIENFYNQVSNEIL